MLEHSHIQHGRLKLRALGVVALLSTIAAFILTILCIFAGSKPNMMENYDMFTLNLTRFGDNLIIDLDNDLSNLPSLITGHLAKREVNALVPVRTPSPVLRGPITETPATTPSPTLAPRDFRSDLSAGESDIGSHASNLESDASSATSRVGSDISSETSKIASEATSAIGALPSEFEAELNKEFMKLKTDLDMPDWYSVHLLDYCQGYYSPNSSDQTNSTIHGIPAPVYPGQKVTKQVISCTKHTLLSDFDPKTALLIVYWIAVVFIGLSLILSFISAFSLGWVGPFLNVWLSLGAFFFIGVASALTTGIAVGAAKLITALGNDFGLAAYQGDNFFKLTWTPTALMLLNAIIWAWEFGHRFRRDFGAHLSPAWQGLKNGLNPTAASRAYETEKYEGDVSP
ncbi:MAG: hypothetical protein M1821_002928 [Bathelium mastoideum]|nr:MAG: hypothetical protein M1821_002928 [Bathelium mastoideum]KAI9694429.1 MAG: hypothetical protein M1822_000045 [Bathelium mastoideum]